jgi:hypothetical protein
MGVQGLGGTWKTTDAVADSGGGCRRRRRRDEIRRGVGAERSALIQGAVVLCWRVRSAHLAPVVHDHERGGSRPRPCLKIERESETYP